jgi:sugar phosphate isomerase/epimerase
LLRPQSTFQLRKPPEKSPEEIMDKIDGGSDSIGICVDTAAGHTGLDAPTTIRDIYDRVRHIHLKDVAAIGGHETVLLGSGVVDIAEPVAAAKEIDTTVGIRGRRTGKPQPV